MLIQHLLSHSFHDIFLPTLEPAHISFNLKQTSYTTFTDWDLWDLDIDGHFPNNHIKKQLRQGDYKTLNAYYVLRFPQESKMLVSHQRDVHLINWSITVTA